ncbi:helix-turn-helix domain-containing protein [Vicingaceae bacterium]|nr:helix-turn-helix domain-containing protein [Vicingaceae bacterium]
MEHTISFEQMPGLIAQISLKLETIESLLIDQSETALPEHSDELLGVKETAEFLSLSVQTIYGKVSKGELPVMKRSKKLYFSKDDLMNYLKRGRIKTNLEIQEEANKQLSR